MLKKNYKSLEEHIKEWFMVYPYTALNNYEVTTSHSQTGSANLKEEKYMIKG